MKTPVALLLVAITLAACSNNPPVLQNNKALDFTYNEPNRRPLNANLVQQYGLQGINSDEKAALTPSAYYSANGHYCRKLPDNKVACLVRGSWLESAPVTSH